MSLRDRLIARIARDGPISIADYMSACLHDPDDGYYATRPRMGAAGDFVTAPLVSQMFGEMLGLWAVEVWVRLGAPPRVRLIELGPGDGTMMSDVLRATKAAPDFMAACEVWLVETSAPLRERQAAALAGSGSRWASSLAALPTDAPVIILANELLDCMPISQTVYIDGLWVERRVGVDDDGALVFLPPLYGEGDSPPGRAKRAPEDRLRERGGVPAAPSPRVSSRYPTPDFDSLRLDPRHKGEGGHLVHEHSLALTDFAREAAALVAKTSGAALFIDYGRDAAGYGDTLQALRGHKKESPLAHPGAADLTAHVDFPAFAAAAGDGATAIVSQRDFLRRLGIETRAAALTRARPDRADVIARQLDRLIGHDHMGALFKVVGLRCGDATLPGF